MACYLVIKIYLHSGMLVYMWVCMHGVPMPIHVPIDQWAVQVGVTCGYGHSCLDSRRLGQLVWVLGLSLIWAAIFGIRR